MRESDPGAPEALPKTVRLLAERIGVDGIDRIWIFPPLRRGRKEWGLVVASRFVGDGDRRRLYTARYVAERSSEGLAYEPELTQEGDLPADRFNRLLAGVVRRSEPDLGDPRPVEVDGQSDRLDELLEELESSHSEKWT